MVGGHGIGWKWSHLGCLAIEESVVVAGLEIDGNGAVCMGLDIAG